MQEVPWSMVKPDRATLGGVLDYKAKAQSSIRASLLMWERSCIEFYDALYSGISDLNQAGPRQKSGDPKMARYSF